MSERISEKEMLILFKNESTYNTFATPGSTDWIPAFDIEGLNAEGDELQSEVQCGKLGSRSKILVGRHVAPKFSFYLTGSGVAGAPPAWGAVMRACGYREDIFPGLRVEYTPVSADYESGSLIGYAGDNKHSAKGLRGNISFSVSPKNYLVGTVELVGNYMTAADGAGHAVPDCNSGVEPLPVGPDHTSLSLLGLSDLDFYSLNLDSGRSGKYEEFISSRGTDIDNREMSGDIEFAALPISVKDWDESNGDTGALLLTHGTTGGRIVEISNPHVQIGKHAYGSQDGYKSSKLPLNIMPNVTDDDIKVVVK